MTPASSSSRPWGEAENGHPGIVAVPKVNKSIFRVNRDTRFSLDPSPYKTNLGLYFWDGPARGWSPRATMSDSSRRTSCSARDVRHPDSLLGRYRRPSSTRGEARRSRRSWPRSGGSRAARSKGAIISECRRVRSRPSERRAPQAQGLYASFEMKVPDEFFSAGFVEYCYERFAPAAPLHRWLMRLFGQGSRRNRGGNDEKSEPCPDLGHDTGRRAIGGSACARKAPLPPPVSRGYSIRSSIWRGRGRQVVVDREPGQYLGHPTTVLLEDGRTMIAVYPRATARGHHHEAERRRRPDLERATARAGELGDLARDADHP